MNTFPQPPFFLHIPVYEEKRKTLPDPFPPLRGRSSWNPISKYTSRSLWRCLYPTDRPTNRLPTWMFSLSRSSSDFLPTRTTTVPVPQSTFTSESGSPEWCRNAYAAWRKLHLRFTQPNSTIQFQCSHTKKKTLFAYTPDRCTPQHHKNFHQTNNSPNYAITIKSAPAVVAINLPIKHCTLFFLCEHKHFLPSTFTTCFQQNTKPRYWH